jgi:hypothetical protein
MTEIITERAFTPSAYVWTIFANDIAERLETHTHDSLRRPLASPVTFTIPARREWFGQHRRSGAVLGPFGSREEAQAAVDADDDAKASEWTAWLNVKEFLGFVATGVFASCIAGVICAFIPAIEWSWFLSLFGVAEHDFPNRNTYAVDCVFIFGFFAVHWCSEGGPPRPWRGILTGRMAKRIGVLVFSFFAIVMLATVVIDFIDTGTISLCKPHYHMTADGSCQ